MRTYLLTMYYPSLAKAQESVRQCQEAVKKLAGNDWKLIKAGGNVLSITFATDAEARRIQSHFIDPGREDFQLLIVEIASVPAGWIEKSAYQWINSRLARG
jgi:hypothetical protein